MALNTIFKVIRLSGVNPKPYFLYFIYSKISNFVYNIRIKKYEERMQEIKRELPAIEAKLKKK